ncbi:MAG: SDR family NAD(P)-dependent oxidoreductase [Rubrivivax sp.]|nr:SDR family NAD(P)-dependent oxidoreductase [Rubrivivax sp.]
MPSLPDGYRALVIGASGAIGSAFVAQLQADPRCAAVVGLHRGSVPAIDFEHSSSVAAAAAALSGRSPWHLIVVATGRLHAPLAMPEKRLADIDAAALEALLRINTVGPALLLRHLAPQLDRQRSVMALLSAKVGSIGDNRLGGWYGYRASKAALNMLIKTAAIELRRTHPGAVLAALHPGTVRSALSRPFRGDEIGRDPAAAVAQMRAALDALQPEDSGSFLAYDGERLPW